MTKENPKIKSVLKSLFSVSIEKLIKDITTPSSISNLYVQFDPEAGEVQIYDEREHLLHKKVIFDWVGIGSKNIDYMPRILAVLKQVVEGLVSDGLFEHQLFMKPFSVCLTDEEFKPVEEIYILDDDSSLQEDELMKGLDKELDDFFKNLLSDVE